MLPVQPYRLPIQAYSTVGALRMWSSDTYPRRKKKVKYRPILAVMGDPIGHSFSPQMMFPALRSLNIMEDYIRLYIKEGELEEALKLMPPLGFIGANVTIPHKLRALELSDEVEPLARQLGAVNTLSMRDGRLLGYNTDGPGFLRALDEEFSVRPSDLRILVLGAGGGAGRATAIQSALAGCSKLVLVNRTKEKAEQLASHLASDHGVKEVAAVDWNDEALRPWMDEVDLIVNATSLGMKLEDPPLFGDGMLQSRHLVLDMVYLPNETPLVALAKKAGARAANGLSMLLHQGALSFEKWYEGAKAPVESMRWSLKQAAGILFPPEPTSAT